MFKFQSAHIYSGPVSGSATGMEELEVIGGDGELVFRKKHTKEAISARVVGPREIVGIPGSWVDAVFKLDGDLDFFEEVLNHLETKGNVDRVIVKLKASNERIRRKLEDKGFVHLGMNVFTKPVSDRLMKFM